MGEYHYARGWRGRLPPPEAARHLELAFRNFPLQPDNRLAAANYYALNRWPGSRPLAIGAIMEAVGRDPWNAPLHRNLAGLLWEDGDRAAAMQELSIVKMISPRGNLTIVVNNNPATGGALPDAQRRLDSPR